mmetsp:Transcript_35059/g.48619  ORF Transcript_35059/g.48619 Transcript_35059/m.48619 type:complete len:359 (+) Transcript_35059:1-1077(+)
MGLAYGSATFRKPLPSTGRADYFGPLPNKAARMLHSAAPGQVIVDGTHLRMLYGECIPLLPPLPVIAPLLSKGDSRTTFTRLPSGKYVISKIARRLSTSGIANILSSLSSIQNMRRPSSSGFAVKKGSLEELNMIARWECEVNLEKFPDIGPVKLKGLGLFKIKGLSRPVPLVQAWLPELDKRELPIPENCVLVQDPVSNSNTPINSSLQPLRARNIRRKQRSSITVSSNEIQSLPPGFGVNNIEYPETPIYQSSSSSENSPTVSRVRPFKEIYDVMRNRTTTNTLLDLHVDTRGRDQSGIVLNIDAEQATPFDHFTSFNAEPESPNAELFTTINVPGNVTQPSKSTTSNRITFEDLE